MTPRRGRPAVPSARHRDWRLWWSNWWDRFLDTRLAYVLQWILIIAWMIFAGWLEFGLGICLTPGFYCSASSGF